ncbi:MAG: phosphate ABC transporter permease PstA [Desulfomicrobiaceae bacterium]|nr:phosphate ABC transporter permease PstA [Desulfomicrobiaceae bacterium]
MTLPTDPALHARRKAKERRFKTMSYAAILVAGVFLVFFFADILRQGLPALKQAEILVPIHFTQDILEYPESSLPPEYVPLVSRGVVRLFPNELHATPKLLGSTQERWVLATADVDQFLKGKPNRLKAKERRTAERLQSEGRLRLAWNIGFFTNGDSKLPEMAGVFAAAVGSVYVLLVTLAFSFPIGVMAAVYLEEFAPDNRLMQIIEVNINNLAAIPSILFGLLGLAIFIQFFGIPRSSSVVGGLTLGLMTLPVIIIATRAAIRAIPSAIREGAMALGATRWQVVWDHILPLALPGILTGTIIGLARAIGETAPLILVGMVAFIPQPAASFLEATSVLPAQIYTWASDSQRAFVERTAAGIVVLLVILLSMNALAIFLRTKYERKW